MKNFVTKKKLQLEMFVSLDLNLNNLWKMKDGSRNAKTQNLKLLDYGMNFMSQPLYLNIWHRPVWIAKCPINYAINCVYRFDAVRSYNNAELYVVK